MSRQRSHNVSLKKEKSRIINIPRSKSSRRESVVNRHAGRMETKKGKKGYRRHPKHKNNRDY